MRTDDHDDDDDENHATEDTSSVILVNHPASAPKWANVVLDAVSECVLSIGMLAHDAQCSVLKLNANALLLS